MLAVALPPVTSDAVASTPNAGPEFTEGHFISSFPLALLVMLTSPVLTVMDNVVSHFFLG